MTRRATLLCGIALALFVVWTGGAGAASTAPEHFPVGWWNSSPWTTVQAPGTPTGYVRLYEPRREVIGALGRPSGISFDCGNTCNRRLAAQLDVWFKNNTLWNIIFASRSSAATPRAAVAIFAVGHWGYLGVHGGERSRSLWRQHLLPCRRSTFQIVLPPVVTFRMVQCERSVRQHFEGRRYAVHASVGAVNNRVEVLGIADERGLGELAPAPRHARSSQQTAPAQESAPPIEARAAPGAAAWLRASLLGR